MLLTEDVLSTRVATYFSTEASYLVYAAFNDTEVDFIRYPLYGDSDSVYTTLREISYPMVRTLDITFTDNINIIHQVSHKLNPVCNINTLIIVFNG